MNLIIFFNGWGMDDSILEKKENNKTPYSNFHILYVNYPYNLEITEEFISGFKSVYFVGWSFGVYYLNKYISKNLNFKRFKAFGINGTPEILGKYGISEKMMRLTMDSLSDESLVKFYNNMGAIKDIVPKKNINSLKLEIKDLIDNYTLYPNFIDFFIIGDNDRIVSSKSQKKYSLDSNTEFALLEAGHMPFEDEETLIDVILKFSSDINKNNYL